MQPLAPLVGTLALHALGVRADFWAVNYFEAFQEGFKFVKEPQCTPELNNAVIYPQYPDISGGRKGCVYIQIGIEASLFECNTDEFGSFTYNRARDNNIYDADGNVKGSCEPNMDWKFSCQFGLIKFANGWSILNCTSEDLKLPDLE